MSWVRDTVAEFGRQIGLPALEIGAHGVAQLELQAGGILAVEAPDSSPDVLVYLGRPLGFDGDAALRHTLARAHHANAHPIPVQIGVRGHGPDALLLVLARMPRREFTPQSLARVVEYLGRWSDGARHG